MNKKFVHEIKSKNGTLCFLLSAAFGLHIDLLFSHKNEYEDKSQLIDEV